MIITIIILSILFLAACYVIFNLNRKLESSEDILISYFGYLDSISRVIEASEINLKKIDEKGSFESDDEVGAFFKGLKEIQSILDKFNIKKL